MTEEKRPVTLITGASSGIGAALAHEFAANGHELVLVARREQALAALADAIAAMGTTRPTVLPADLGRADATQAIAEALDRRGLEPDVVVNNAGFGLLGAADTLDRAEQLAMIAPRRTRAHRSFARLCRQPQTPQGRHSQPGVDRGV